MVVGIEPPPSPYGPEGPALILTTTGLLVLNGTLGLQLVWLALIVAAALGRRHLEALSARSGLGGTDAGGADGGAPGGDGLPGPRDQGPTPGGGTR